MRPVRRGCLPGRLPRGRPSSASARLVVSNRAFWAAVICGGWRPVCASGPRSQCWVPDGAKGPGLTGKAQVLDESRPRSGPGLVARVQVPFASADGFAVYEARKAPQTAEEVGLAGRRTVVGGAARLRLAEDKARADDAAAQQAVKAVSTDAPLSKAAAGRSGRGRQGPRNGHEGGERFPGGGKPVGPSREAGDLGQAGANASRGATYVGERGVRRGFRPPGQDCRLGADRVRCLVVVAIRCLGKRISLVM